MGRNPFLHQQEHAQPTKNSRGRTGKEVSKQARVAGKRSGGALRAEFARSQKRRDNKPR